MVNIGVVVGSHLNDAMIEVSINPEMAKKRMKFVKVLTFHNENLQRDVSQEYIDWLWSEIFENNGVGAPFLNKVSENLTLV